ncbi:MAG: FUN14 domain-containing protein [Candidatus Bathyarchaeia archaeon]
MSEIFSPVVYQLGIGGMGGFIVGYAIKKLSKLIAFLMGLFIIALMYLGVKGIININWGKFFEELMGGLETVEWLIGLISILPFIGSFAVGFLLGFKVG